MHLLLPAEEWQYSGPPPQAILDMLWLWKLLMASFCVVLVLALLVHDIPGVLLIACLLWFGWNMLRDGMQELPKYALIYAMLCGLCFLFDCLAFLNELAGRYARTPERNMLRLHVIYGLPVPEHMVTTTMTSFFDLSQGFAYNVQSVLMILRPCLMCLGCYLGTSAHHALHSYFPTAEIGGFREDAIVMNSASLTAFQEARLRSNVMEQPLGQEGTPASARSSINLHFQGSSYRLQRSRSPSPKLAHRQ